MDESDEGADKDGGGSEGRSRRALVARSSAGSDIDDAYRQMVGGLDAHVSDDESFPPTVCHSESEEHTRHIPLGFDRPPQPWVSQEMQDVYRVGGRVTTEDLAFEVFGNLTVMDQHVLIDGWAARSGRAVRTSSLCSGSDATMRGQKDAVQVLNAVSPRLHAGGHFQQVRSTQLLACEKEAAKRRFILHNGDSPLLFHDIVEVGTEHKAMEGAGEGGSLRRVPRDSCDNVWSSFSCKSASFENKSRKDFGCMISEETGASTGETGVTFDGTVDYITNSATKWGSSENVVGLLASFSCENKSRQNKRVPIEVAGAVVPFVSQGGQACGADVAGNAQPIVQFNGDEDEDTVTQALESYSSLLGAPLNDNMTVIYGRFRTAGFGVCHVVLWNHRFFHPHRRGRVWFVFVSATRLNLELEDVQARARKVCLKLEVLQQKCSKCTLELDELLFPLSHDRLREENEKLLDRWDAASKKVYSTTKNAHKRTREASWIDDARICFDELGLEWVEPPPGAAAQGHIAKCSLDPQLEAGSIAYATLPTREKYNLYLMMKKWPWTGEEPAKRVFNLTRSFSRSLHERPRHNVMPCVLPNSKLWLEHVKRVALPEEKMASQGFALGSLAPRTPAAVLNSLAGNAVSVVICSAIFFCVMTEFIQDLNQVEQEADGSDAKRVE